MSNQGEFDHELKQRDELAIHNYSVDKTSYEDPNEGVVPTTKKEIVGFYMYAIAYLPNTLASSNFVPLMIGEFAKRAGTALDGVTPCDYMNPRAQCLVSIGSKLIPTTSFSLYTNTVGVAIQATGLILFSALADRNSWRSRFVFGLTLVGGIFSSLYIFITESNLYWLMALCYLFTNITAGMSSAYYFSYLPVLARSHSEVLKAKEENKYETPEISARNVSKVRDRVANAMSGQSLAMGMIAASVVLFIAYGIGRNSTSSTFSQQIGASMAGMWWLVAGLGSWYLLPKTPGPDLPPGHDAFTHSIRMVWYSILEVGSAWYIWLGLLSWFFISDALNTLLMVTMFVGSSKLGVAGSSTVLLSAVAPLAEAAGIIFLSQIKIFIVEKIGRGKAPWGCSTKGMSIFLTLWCVFLCIYGLIGKYSDTIGLKSKWEYYIYFTIVVTIYACLQSFHRVMFSEIVPAGREAEFFGLYLICYRGTSWIGSLSFGAIKQATGEERWGFVFVLVLFVAGILAMLPINVEKARRHAASLVLDTKV